MDDDFEPLGEAPEVQVQIRFTTKLDIAIPETQFAVPDKLARYGLSELINHLLNQTGIFLRVTDSDYIFPEHIR